jgi:hypothetical protein
MFLRHSLEAALWVLTAVGACVLLAALAGDARSGKLQPWVLVVAVWGIALASAVIHHLSRYLAQRLGLAEEALARARMARARRKAVAG